MLCKQNLRANSYVCVYVCSTPQNIGHKTTNLIFTLACPNSPTNQPIWPLFQFYIGRSKNGNKHIWPSPHVRGLRLLSTNLALLPRVVRLDARDGRLRLPAPHKRTQDSPGTSPLPPFRFFILKQTNKLAWQTNFLTPPDSTTS